MRHGPVCHGVQVLLGQRSRQPYSCLRSQRPLFEWQVGWHSSSDLIGFADVGDGVYLDHHAWNQPQIAAHCGAGRIRLPEAARVDRIVPEKQARILQMSAHLYYVVERGSFRFEDQLDVVYSGLSLLLDGLTLHRTVRTDGTRPGYEDKIT